MEIVTDRKIMVCMIYEDWEFTITYSNIGVEHSYIHLPIYAHVWIIDDAW